jgi:hypothetical protein
MLDLPARRGAESEQRAANTEEKVKIDLCLYVVSFLFFSSSLPYRRIRKKVVDSIVQVTCSTRICNSTSSGYICNLLLSGS